MPASQMCFCTLWLLLLLSWPFFPAAVFADTVIEQRLYQRTFGAETTLLRWQFLDGDPQRLRTELAAETDQTELDKSFATQSWQLENTEQKTALRIERQQERLKISGQFKGEAIDRWEQIDVSPWFQTLSISFRPFLASSEQTISFWTIRPDTLDVYKLKASKKGSEKLQLQGQQVTATRLEVRLAGLRALFWKADYWFRNSDGAFLRYVGPGGLPGAPKIIVEMATEK